MRDYKDRGARSHSGHLHLDGRDKLLFTATKPGRRNLANHFITANDKLGKRFAVITLINLIKYTLMVGTRLRSFVDRIN